MTRETKIGLLVGLAFIVVFAVLLSHTGTVPPPGESPATVIANNTRSNTPVLDNGVHGDINNPEPLQVDAVAPAPATHPAESEQPTPPAYVDASDANDSDLPGPTAFNPVPAGPGMQVAMAERPRGEVPELPPTSVGMHQRSMPPMQVPDPKPTVRSDELIASVPPDPSSSTMIALTGDTKAPALEQAKGKEHVVQSHESLYKIAKEYYNSASPKCIKLIVTANDLKDANTVVEGQKLVIPALPPGMFEGGRLDTQTVAAKPKSLSLDELEQHVRPGKKGSKSGTEKGVAVAPKAPEGTENAITVGAEQGNEMTVDLTKQGPAKHENKGVVPAGTSHGKTPKDAKGKDGKESKPPRDGKELREGRPSRVVAERKDKGEEMYRMYEVKPKDTLQTIARDNLESSQRWQEIKRLNPNVDPQRMKPGERIKVPRTKPVSSLPETGRASA